MVTGQAAALRLLWRDRCTISVGEGRAGDDHITRFEWLPYMEDEPCKLSFESIVSAGDGIAATVAQGVKVFLRPDIEIRPGSRFAIERGGRTMLFKQSGVAAVFSHHQEILLQTAEDMA